MLLEARYTRPPAPPSGYSPSSCRRSGVGVIDSYNGLLQSPQGPPAEYWTNGTTTIVMYEDEEKKDKEQRNGGGASLPGMRCRSTSMRPPWIAEPTAKDSPPSTPFHHQQALVRNSLIAGSVAGMASTVALYPMDLLRTRMQTLGFASAAATASTRTTSAATATAPLAAAVASNATSPWQVLQQVLRQGGFRALYTGMALPVAAQAVYKGTVFTVNNVAQDFLLGHRTLENHKLGRIMDGELTFMDRFASGCIGGAVNAWLFVTPVELVRNQMIAMATASAPSPSPSSSSQPRPGFNSAAVLRRPASFRRQWQSSPPSSWGVIQSSVRNHGISSLWRGASWSVARDGWGCGWFFVAMHYAQERLTRDLDDGSPPGLGVRIVSGGMAGLAYWVAALPLDTVKTWVQSADLRHGSLSVAESIRSIQRREGATGVVRQLFRGWQVAYGRGIPSAAITMIVYSWTFDQLQQSSHRSTMSGAV